MSRRLHLTAATVVAIVAGVALSFAMTRTEGPEVAVDLENAGTTAAATEVASIAAPSTPTVGAEVPDTVVSSTDAGKPALAGSRPPVEVWKSPSCGCCKDWVSYLEDAGFPVTVHDTDDMNSVKARLGLPGPELASCHTATIDGYLVEGHVPISDIERLLAERPAIVGITAPGMPMMSPGMGSLTPRDYDVLSFDEAGNQAIFSRY